jgi:hypothetical protein
MNAGDPRKIIALPCLCGRAVERRLQGSWICTFPHRTLLGGFFIRKVEEAVL